MASTGFSDWAYKQVVINGHNLEAIKDDSGKNIEWMNTTTGESYRVVNSIELPLNKQEE